MRVVSVRTSTCGPAVRDARDARVRVICGSTTRRRRRGGSLTRIARTAQSVVILMFDVVRSMAGTHQRPAAETAE